MRKLNFILPFYFSILLLNGCSKKNFIPAQTKICMDTVCSINAFDDASEKLYAEIFCRLNDIEKTFSPTLADSEVNRINKMAGENFIEASDDFMKVLQTANKISRLSDGALDITAGPLINLWGINTDHQKIPSEDEIMQAKKLIDSEKICIDGGKIFLSREGMSLNFGAVVKGFAADEITKILKSHKVKKAIIDLGGNIYAYGEKADHRPWIIGVKNPKEPEGNPLLKIYAKDISIVTSGNYERFFESNGKRFHHILDTKTGAPADNGIDSVTIACKESIVADCLSTAAFVLGINGTKKILPEMEKEFSTKIGCVFIKSDGTFECIGNIDAKPY